MFILHLALLGCASKNPGAAVAPQQAERPAAFLDIERSYPDGTGEDWPHFDCSAAGGVLVRERPMFFAAGEGSTLEAGAHARVQKACEASLPLLAKGSPENLDAMMRILYPALAELPDERLQWHAYGYLTSHIGEGYWRWALQLEAGEKRTDLLQRAMTAFEDALRSPGGFPNPWVHLRIGQLALELGQDARALDELTRAYMAGARAFFANEDPRYMALLDANLRPPPGLDKLP